MTCDTPALAVDDENTWPDAVRSLLTAELEVLRGYEEHRERVAFMGTVAYLLAGQPENPFRDAREDIVQAVDQQIGCRSLVGYHCTRLVTEEIEEIERAGLRPLESDLAIQRIRRLVQAGYLDASIAASLEAKGQMAEKYRKGMAWFVFTASVLRQESGVGPLLRHWGGEAIYGYHMQDQHTGPVLRRIGDPCIVEAVVPIKEIETFMSVGERLVAAYLGRRGISTRAGPEMEGYVRVQVAVRRVIRCPDPDFECLTGQTTWRRPLG